MMIHGIWGCGNIRNSWWEPAIQFLIRIEITIWCYESRIIQLIVKLPVSKFHWDWEREFFRERFPFTRDSLARSQGQIWFRLSNRSRVQSRTPSSSACHPHRHALHQRFATRTSRLPLGVIWPLRRSNTPVDSWIEVWHAAKRRERQAPLTERGGEGGEENVGNHEIERMRMWCQRGTLGGIKLIETREGGTITHASSIESNVTHACKREVRTKGNERRKRERGKCQERTHTWTFARCVFDSWFLAISAALTACNIHVRFNALLRKKLLPLTLIIAL